MAPTVGAALRPVDGNATQQHVDGGRCRHERLAVQASPGSPAKHASAASPAGSSRVSDLYRAFVPTATQDEVAEQIAADHMKQLHLSPDASANLPSLDSPAFTVHTDSVRSPSVENDPTAAVRVDEFLTIRVLYGAHCAEDTPNAADLHPCKQWLVSTPLSPGRIHGGCDVDVSVPEAGAQDVAASDRVWVGLQFCNTHGSTSYTVQVRAGGGPIERVVVAPGDTVLSTVPYARVGVAEAGAQPGDGCALLSPRSASVPTKNSVVAVFTQPDPIGITFDECEDVRDGAKYLVVNSVQPGTQAGDEHAGGGAALICPGMVVQKINGGDEDTEVHVSTLYREYGQIPPQIFAIRPLGLVLSAPDHGIVEAELLERPAHEKAVESEDGAARSLVRIRIS